MARVVKGLFVLSGVFCAGFLVLRFCNSQCCAGRSRFSVLIVVQEIFSCRSPRGEFCEPPQGGASARTAEAGVYLCKLRSP